MKKILRILAAFGLAALLYGGWYGFHTWNRMKQVRTQADLQVLVREIKRVTASGRDLTSTVMTELVRESGDGVDGWGNQFSFRVEESGSYVVISPGRDGQLDLPSLDAYFLAKPEMVQGDYAKDIFFRNGRPIWNAGK